MSTMLLITIEKKDKELAEHYLNQIRESIEVEEIECKEFTGNGDILKFILELSPIIVPTLLAWIKAAYKSKSQIVFEYNGIKISGASEKVAAETIIKLAETLKENHDIDQIKDEKEYMDQGNNKNENQKKKKDSDKDENKN